MTDSLKGNINEAQARRTREILSAHPEIRELFGNTPLTAVAGILVVLLQISLAVLVSHHTVGAALLFAYCVGTIPAYALVALIHECDHNLVFKSSRANCVLAIILNLPMIIVFGISDRIVHIRHHLNLNDPVLDVTVPRAIEARIVGRSRWRRALWLQFWMFIHAATITAFLRRFPSLQRWLFVNVSCQVLTAAAVVYFLGWSSLIYLFCSVWFATAIHPLGARVVQEHMIHQPGILTYSYYGKWNWLIFNFGYHAEHHDFVRIPWSRLPKLKKLAPEYYETQPYFTSYSRLLFGFLTDPDVRLDSRTVSA